jgi:hypothetical protein
MRLERGQALASETLVLAARLQEGSDLGIWTGWAEEEERNGRVTVKMDGHHPEMVQC